MRANERDSRWQERLAHYDVVGRLLPLDARVRQLARHAEVLGRAILDADGLLTRGATVLATITALRIAASAAPDDAACDVRFEALHEFVVRLPDENHREHVVNLIDAAFHAEDEQRRSAGKPPYSRRIERWLREDEGLGRPVWFDRRRDAAAIVEIPKADLDLYAKAARDDDVDLVLGQASEIVRDLIDLPSGGVRTEGAYDALALSSFTLCVWPIEAAERKTTLRILQRTLRRRRPIAAAILDVHLRLAARSTTSHET